MEEIFYQTHYDFSKISRFLADQKQQQDLYIVKHDGDCIETKLLCCQCRNEIEHNTKIAWPDDPVEDRIYCYGGDFHNGKFWCMDCLVKLKKQVESRLDAAGVPQQEISKIISSKFSDAFLSYFKLFKN